MMGALLMMTAIQVTMAQFELSAEIRPRAEYRHGFKKLLAENQDPAFFVEQRSRLVATLKKEKIDFKLSIQDIRIWGSDKQIYKPGESLNGMNVNEAWAAYSFTSKFNLKLGRQELDYDNARILGDLSWAQQSRSHDALLFRYEGKGLKAHLGTAFNQNANTPEYGKLIGNYYGQGNSNYKSLQYLWINKTFQGGKVSALFLNDGKESADSSMQYSQTLGLYTQLSAGKTKIEAEAYYQTGKDVSKKNISAYLLAINASHPLTSSLTAKLGIDLVSGSAATLESGKSNSFDPLYGTHHKFYGFMDYFYVGNPSAINGRNVGLTDPYFSLIYNANTKNNLLASVHYLSSPVDIYKNGDTTSPAMSKRLGTEIDLVYTLKLAQGVSINVGYSQLFATDSMQALKGGSLDLTQNWAWTMITFKPGLFKTEP